MISFVNRDAEIELIDSTFNALQNYQEDLVRTPILDFYGINGIGKTAILQKAVQHCRERGLRYILLDASQQPHQVAEDILEQANRYHIAVSPQHAQMEPQQRVQAVLQDLLALGAFVLLLDAVDATNQEQVRWIETLLRDILEENKLFVLLASKRKLLFTHERSVSRKLTTIALKPFSRSSCELYLEHHASTFTSAVRDCIFEWTDGYPLAMQVMTKAMLEHHLDPLKADDQQPLLDRIFERVIQQGILANITQPGEREECLTALTLLSIPRRFNLRLMQNLIEHFEPETLKRRSSLAYMSMPQKITQATNALNWSPFRAGFSVEAPVRTLFLLKNQIEQPERLAAIHKFLAERNQQFAQEVSGTDRVRYLCEYLYHSTYVEQSQDLPTIIDNTIQSILAEPLSLFQQFLEEFSQDQNLQETLGEHTAQVFSLLYQHLAQGYMQLAGTTSGTERIQYIRELVYYTAKDPKTMDLKAALEQSIQAILAKEPSHQEKIVDELLQDKKFLASLGEHATPLQALLQEDTSLEE